MAFNRVALAAALLEYDNDNPASGLGYRKARESAIIIGAAAPPPPTLLLGRDGKAGRLPEHRFSGRGIIEDRGSTYGYIPGKAREPPSEEVDMADMMMQQQQGGGGGEMDMAEVDLSSWGLPETLIPQQQRLDRDHQRRLQINTNTSVVDGDAYRRDPSISRGSQGVTPSSPLNGVASPSASTYAHTQPVVKPAVTSPLNRRNRKGRTVSFHDYTSIVDPSADSSSFTRQQQGERGGEEDTMEELAHHHHHAQETQTQPAVRPRSSMSVMNRGRPTSPFDAPRHHHASPITAASVIPSPAGSVALPLHIPLPPSPGQAGGEGRLQSQAETRPLTLSPTRSTYGTNNNHSNNENDDQPNPFALPAPAGPRLSRFDPKISSPAGGGQTDGGAAGPSRAAGTVGYNTDRPISQASGYFPQTTTTTTTTQNRTSFPPPPRPQPQQHPSTMSRLRPRTLLMPTPLHGAHDPTQNQPPSRWDQDGFSRGAKPMPPGALTRPDSFVGQLNDKAALTGAGTGGKRRPTTSTRQLFSVALAGVEGHGHGYGYEAGLVDIPPSAQRDGEVGVQQYGGRRGRFGEEGSEFDEEEEEEEEDSRIAGEQDWRPETRFVQGPSLMDRLEARKAELKSKQRVFRGDNRPAMMSRTSTGPLVNLDATIDPLTGQTSPRLQKRASLVLQDDDGRPLVRSGSQQHGDQPGRPKMPRGKSVFGVDTLWEKELKKLEAQKDSERVLAAQVEEGKRKKGGKRGKKGKRQDRESEPEQDQEGTAVGTHPHTQTMYSQGRTDVDMPPSLSLGDLAAALHAPFNPSEGPISNANPIPHANVDVDDWAAGSDEDGDGSAAQPRRRKRRTTVKPVVVPDTEGGSDSEDDDVPLAKAFGVTRAKSKAEESDSSEDEPLSNLKKKVSSRTLDAADEDDIPLALRRAQKSGNGAVHHAVDATMDEDDMPLAQRRLRAQGTGITDPGSQQQQQQHLAMAMQQHQSMMMNPMMSMYGGSMNMGMMGMGMPSPMGMMPGASLPFGPMAFHNASAFSMPHALPPPPPDPKIDRWRREIEAREGSMVSAPPSAVTSGGRT